MPLSSPRFRWSSRLQQAEKNSPPLRSGEQGQGVRLIQQAMVNLGIDPMTASLKKHGSPDGIFGAETKQAVKKYQSSKGLTPDGIVGQNTMRALDADLPGAGPHLPPLPAGPTRYVVPGIAVARDQLKKGHRNLCWAYVYAMMISWKRQQSLEVRQLIADVGATWVAKYDANVGLAVSAASSFLRAAGMRVEPLMSFPVSQWAEMLRSHGPLTIYGLNNSLAGAHARMVYGIQGDGSPQHSTVLILDPWRGVSYGEPYEKFAEKYRGFAEYATVTAQIAHF